MAKTTKKTVKKPATKAKPKAVKKPAKKIGQKIDQNVKAKALKAKPVASKKIIKKSKLKTYTETQKDNICAKVFLLMAAGRSVRSIFEDNKPVEFPAYSNFRRWIDENEDRGAQYTHAREARNQYMFEEIQAIADDSSNDYMENKQGDEVLNSEHVQRSKLRIDARKWMLGKLDSSKYGDKVTLEGNEDKPFKIIHLGGPEPGKK